ncbi:MAG: PEP/pyruvate-binding domain-containing protein [Clostridiales bacterium]
MIKWFKDIKSDEFELVGGKGINLSKLYNKNLNVPNGFIILSTSYDAYIKNTGIKKEMDKILLSDVSTKIKSDKIKRLFSKESFDKELKELIIKEFNKLENKVAVRSSSTIEDLPEFSFAGQYTSYLNIDKSNLIETILMCWQSLWNERAIEYRFKNTIKINFSHCVIVQELVNANVAGVVFSANPLTGNRDEVVVNSSFGFGESIVSGDVNPDQYIVNKNSNEILDKKINSKEFKFVENTIGIKKEKLDSNKSKCESLNTEQLVLLINEAKKIESLFNKPQDIEFAFNKDNKLCILQSRDITTLFPVDNLEHDGKLRLYMSASTVLLGTKEPFTPMGFDIMSNMFPTIINVMTRKRKPLTNSFVKYAANRIYVDMTYIMSSNFAAKQFANSFSGNDLPLKEVMLKAIKDNGKRFRKQGIRFRLPLGIFSYSIIMAVKAFKIIKIPNEKRYDEIIELGNKCYNTQLEKYDDSLSVEEKVDFANKSLIEAFKLSQQQAMYCLEVSNYNKIEKILKKYFGKKYRPEVLVQSLPKCFTQNMMLKLNQYAKYCDDNNLKPSTDDKMFKEILKIYGHRGNIELDIGTNRWNEDPSYLIDLTKSFIIDRTYIRNMNDYYKKRDEAESFIDNIYNELCKVKGKNKAEKVKKLMINYRIAAGMREFPKSDIVRFLELGRKALISIGEEFVKNALIENSKDIFYLHTRDISNFVNGKEIDLKNIITMNKDIYNKEMLRTSIPRLVLNNGVTYYYASSIDKGANVLKGMSLSPGVFEGFIKIVNDPQNNCLKKDEIMVTESTNPSWTPLFATAGALIMEYGGPMSHGGIVAREYGIPAVVGIPRAKEILKDGQKVRVNGEEGIVEIIV